MTKALPRSLTPLVASVLVAGGAFAQAPGGGAGMEAGPPAAAPAAAGASGPSAGASQGTAAPAPAAASAGPAQLLGLIPVEDPPVISLEEAMQIVAERSFDLRIAEEQITQAGTQLRRAWAMILPQVSIGGTYTYSFPEQKVAFGDPSQNAQQALLFHSIADITESSAEFSNDPAARAAALQRAEQLRRAARDIESAKPLDIVIQPAHALAGQLQVSLPLFNGRALPLISNAYEAIDLSRAVVEQAQASLMLATTQTYYGAVTAKKMHGIAEEQLENARRHRDALKEREALGMATAIALQRADLDVVRAEQSVRAAHQGYLIALGALGQLMAREELFHVEAPRPVPAIEGSDPVDGLIARALAARPEIAVQRSSLAIAERMRTDAWMAFLPSLNLVGQGRYSSNTSGFTSDPITGAIMVQANIPLYDGGARYATLKETASKIEQEKLRLEQAESRIRSQVRGNVADIALKQQALEIARRGLTLASDTRANAERLFELGAATSLDVIDANLAVFFAQIELARAELDVEQARLGLAYVTGGLTPVYLAPTTTPAAP